ncbi:hypothetical protein PHYPSEUDO_004103 [Phytophthora pseudosyringae]|uniref:CBM1 domain-containing protein n=1 Tax=Phytophthora pseudosyringae TaxID=221518 RepID=A0A8T1WEI5_9STRA|nr:hypothetical protein PHYPSEUDO_004103 [Phytophthora pseudosyringae]
MKIFSVTLMTSVVGVSKATPGLWEQCRSENGTEIACDAGLVCVPDVEYYGLCYTEVVEEAGQCGGLGWNVSCVNGTACARQNEGWASCESTVDDGLYTAAEWQRCDPEDSSNACADDLICVDDDDYHGLCVKEVAELWGQCGGSGWATVCEIGSYCAVKTATYRQCVSDDSQVDDSSSGDDSVGDDEALTAVSSQKQGALVLGVFIDMSSLLKPLAQLQEVATAAKKFPCSIRMMLFTETTCEQTRNTT